MKSFLMLERLGDFLEATYQKIYTGDGVEFGICVFRITHMLGRLVDAGMLTDMTRKRIEAFLTKNVEPANLEVISRKTNDVVLLDKVIHKQDSFKLVNFMTWITDELCNDPIMKKLLCGRNSYESVKSVLNDYAKKKT